MSIFKEFLKAGTYIAKETVKADSVQKSDEYQEKKKAIIESYRNVRDALVLDDFHSIYAMHYGNGFVPLNTSSNLSHLKDPKYAAFCDIFQERNFRRTNATCPFCGNTVGYRWHIRKNESGMTLKQLGHYTGGSQSRWSCSCGISYGSWELIENDNGFVSIKLSR